MGRKEAWGERIDSPALEAGWLEQMLRPLPTQGFTDGQSLKMYLCVLGTLLKELEETHTDLQNSKEALFQSKAGQKEIRFQE